MKLITMIIICMFMVGCITTSANTSTNTNKDNKKVVKELSKPPTYRTPNEVTCKIDEFTEKTTCVYVTENIKNFESSSFMIISIDKKRLMFSLNNQSYDGWDLLNKSRIILFKIDGVLHKKKYGLKTHIGNGYVLEFVHILLPKEFVELITNSKECKIRIGCCKETFINQKYKDGIKELLLK